MKKIVWLEAKLSFVCLHVFFVFSRSLARSYMCVLFLLKFSKRLLERCWNFFVHVLPEVAIIARENVMVVMLSFAVVPCLSHFKNISKLSMRWQTQTKDKVDLKDSFTVIPFSNWRRTGFLHTDKYLELYNVHIRHTLRQKP